MPVNTGVLFYKQTIFFSEVCSFLWDSAECRSPISKYYPVLAAPQLNIT